MENNLLDSILDGVESNTPNSRELDILSIKSKILEMNTALLSNNPIMPILLREIHSHLRKDPELVTIISEEEIGMIVNGLKKQTSTELVTSTIKQSTTKATKEKLSKVSVDDI